MTTNSFFQSSRRDFLTTTSTLAAGTLLGGLSIAQSAHASGDDVLRIGLIGCGGRGNGAAIHALNADKNVKLYALGDLFADRIQSGIEAITKEASRNGMANKIDVPPERLFTGFDAYQKVIDSGVDVVLLATPPHFRPAHLAAAVAAGKHCFVEKPVAVDAPGVQSVLAACEEAKKKSLSIVSGLMWRYDIPTQELMKQVHDGAIGDIVVLQASYLTSTLPYYVRKPDWSDMEWQIRNWQYFVWLSGDHNVEQHVHSLDKAAWAMHDEPPVRCSGLGGREMRDPTIGNGYDHFAVVYEYAGGQKLFSRCRQMNGCAPDVSDYLIGTKGTCSVIEGVIDGEKKWRSRGGTPSMYQLEHDKLFASIRSGEPINNGLYMARSTMMAIIGRMSAYTGQLITWEQAMASKEDFSLATYDFGSAPKPVVAKPGVTRFV